MSSCMQTVRAKLALTRTASPAPALCTDSAEALPSTPAACTSPSVFESPAQQANTCQPSCSALRARRGRRTPVLEVLPRGAGVGGLDHDGPAHLHRACHHRLQLVRQQVLQQRLHGLRGDHDVVEEDRLAVEPPEQHRGGGAARRLADEVVRRAELAGQPELHVRLVLPLRAGLVRVRRQRDGDHRAGRVLARHLEAQPALPAPKVQHREVHLPPTPLPAQPKPDRASS